ncbi:MAG TPA: transcription termination/antitermination NusG family protein, partial [Haloplasmataceae bacterium]
MEEKKWYVVQTYSGLENVVKNNLEKRIESMGMSDKIFRVIIPEETEVEYKKGVKKEKVKKIFPGYVFIEMIVTDESWYVVRNTPNVT